MRPSGQQWTTLPALRAGHHNEFRNLEPGLTGVATQPTFAIGQRGLLVQTPSGNLLWDCVSLLDETTTDTIMALGGIDAIAISHPHFYSSMIEYSRTFNAPVFLHAADRHWVQRPDPAITFWEAEQQPLLETLTLVRTGGHFAGSTVLHWPAGANGRGALLTGDTIHVVADRRYASFMYSYPNLIPLPAKSVRALVNAIEPYPFDRLYGGWWDLVIREGAHAAVQRSARRYIAALQADPD